MWWARKTVDKTKTEFKRKSSTKLLSEPDKFQAPGIRPVVFDIIIVYMLRTNRENILKLCIVM